MFPQDGSSSQQEEHGFGGQGSGGQGLGGQGFGHGLGGHGSGLGGVVEQFGERKSNRLISSSFICEMS